MARLLRFLFLGIKPPHFDEGINGWFVDQVVKNGFYNYDPTNYHGPLHFYILLLSQTLFGRNVWALRLPVVCASIAAIYVTLKYEPFLGRTVSRIAAFAMAVSPGFVFSDVIQSTRSGWSSSRSFLCSASSVSGNWEQTTISGASGWD